MHKLRVLVKYNFRRTAVNKSFIIITIIGPFLILAVTVLPGFLASNMSGNEGIRLEVVADESVLSMLEPAAEGGAIVLSGSDSLEASRAACVRGDNDGVVVLSDPVAEEGAYTLYTTESSNIMLTETVRNFVGKAVLGARAAGEGLDPELISYLTSMPAMHVVQLDKSGGGKEGQSFETIIYSALAFIMLLYMTTLLYSQMIGRSVVLEKSSKTVEVMLSSVRPSELMIGKILGMGIAGLVQYGIWIGVSMLLIKVAGPALNLSLPEVFNSGMLGWLLLFFILAFFLYSGLYAALGAMAEDEQSLGQLQWPFLLMLVIPMIMISYLIMNPDSPVVVFMSYFPFTSPMVMFVRIMVSAPSLPMLGLCVAILLVTILLGFVLSGRIFRYAILKTGRVVRFGESFRYLLKGEK